MALNEPTGQPLALQPGEFTPSAPANVVSFKTSQVDLPSPLYIQRDDKIQFIVFSNQVGEIVICKWRLLLPNGVIQQGQSQVASDGSVTYFGTPQDLAEGFLLSASAQASAASLRGQTYVQCAIVRGNIAGQQIAEPLFADYTTQQFAIGWPFGRSISSIEGPGQMIINTVANPAAGADWAFIFLGQRTLFKVIGAAFVLTTGAAVANRIPQLQLQTHGGAAILSSQPNQVVPASTVAQIGASPGITNASANIPGVMIPIASDFYVHGAAIAFAPKLVTVTTNIQAADQYSAITVYCQQWVEF